MGEADGTGVFALADLREEREGANKEANRACMSACSKHLAMADWPSKPLEDFNYEGEKRGCRQWTV